jgi:hypothetical protein
MGQQKGVRKARGQSFLGPYPHSDSHSHSRRRHAERQEPSVSPRFHTRPARPTPSQQISRNSQISARPLRAALPVFSLLALVLTSGANSKAASKESFTQAIHAFEQAHPDRNVVCTHVHTALSDSSGTYDNDIKKQYWFAPLTVLKELGYLTMKDATAAFGRKGVKIDVTPKYTQLFGAPSEEPTPVCVGTFRLQSIQDFTEPSSMMGMTVSQVDATVRQTVTAAWTKDARLAKAVQYQAPPATRKVQYTLVLKDSGWVVGALQ